MWTALRSIILNGWLFHSCVQQKDSIRSNVIWRPNGYMDIMDLPTIHFRKSNSAQINIASAFGSDVMVQESLSAVKSRNRPHRLRWVSSLSSSSLSFSRSTEPPIIVPQSHSKQFPTLKPHRIHTLHCVPEKADPSPNWDVMFRADTLARRKVRKCSFRTFSDSL